jgi:hypothetical protein
MSGGVIPEAGPEPTDSLRARLAVVVVAFVVAGAVAGVVWERLWDAPPGVTYRGHWYLEPAGPDVSFQGIALFVSIALPLGLVLGLLAGLRRGHETATALTVLVASGLAGVVMYAVGSSLSPPDPQALAAGPPPTTAGCPGTPRRWSSCPRGRWLVWSARTSWAASG